MSAPLLRLAFSACIGLGACRSDHATRPQSAGTFGASPGTSDTDAPKSAGNEKPTGAIRIMPLGDSITASGCWRARLWEKLIQNWHSTFRFVGSGVTRDDCGDPNYDGHHEGHSGYQVVDLARGGRNASEPAQWFGSNPAEIVLMHLGTNDCWNGVATDAILGAYTSLLGELRKHSPRVIVLIAQIIPMNPSGCGACSGRVQALNGAIPSWAKTVSTPSSPVVVVDQWTGFDDSADTLDGVHPNDRGSTKMAAKWYDALVRLL